ncbi:MAG: hypothetical protein OET08_07680 [Desulfuromonadales bacterium]|nr:hypothetical protein [Desulfuromonadales bacterium]
MKRGLLLLLLMMIALPCMGMGGLGGSPEGTVPETDVPIRADLKDRDGISTSLNQFSMNGKTFLDTLRGQGQLTIPFQHIDTVTFSEVRDEELKVDVKLKSGNVMTLAIVSDAEFYGSTGYGAFQIKAKNVYSIDFH